jgi:hypothetical protein
MWSCRVQPSAESRNPNMYVLVPAHQLEMFSSSACQCFEVHCPVSPVTCVYNFPLGRNFRLPHHEIGTLLAEWTLDSIFGLAPS